MVICTPLTGLVDKNDERDGNNYWRNLFDGRFVEFAGGMG
jgi:hypothetical protein